MVFSEHDANFYALDKQVNDQSQNISFRSCICRSFLLFNADLFFILGLSS